MRRVKSFVLVAAALALAAIVPETASAQCGIASWYGPKFHGRRTANGEVYNMHGVSAAHKGLPLGSRVRVTHQKTGRSIVVRINDRGPYIAGRIIDLSAGAKAQLGMGGLAPVCIEVLSRGNNRYVGSVTRVKATRKTKTKGKTARRSKKRNYATKRPSRATGVTQVRIKPSGARKKKTDI